MTIAQLPIVESDREIQHRSETRGVVITREQIIKFGGTRKCVRFWTHFESGRLHHIDSIDLCVPA